MVNCSRIRSLPARRNKGWIRLKSTKVKAECWSGPEKSQSSELARPDGQIGSRDETLAHQQIAARGRADAAGRQGQSPRFFRVGLQVEFAALRQPLPPRSRVESAVPAKELRVEAKSLGAHIQRRKVERLELLLIGARVDQRRLVRLLGGQVQDAVLVQRQIGHPVGVLDVSRVATGIPMGIPGFAVHALHQLVRRRIVGRHRRLVGIEGIEHARTRIDVDPQPRQGPMRIVGLGLDQGIRFLVSLPPVVLAMATAHCRERPQDVQRHQPHRTANTLRRLTGATNGHGGPQVLGAPARRAAAGPCSPPSREEARPTAAMPGPKTSYRCESEPTFDIRPPSGCPSRRSPRRERPT